MELWELKLVHIQYKKLSLYGANILLAAISLQEEVIWCKDTKGNWKNWFNFEYTNYQSYKYNKNNSTTCTVTESRLYKIWEKKRNILNKIMQRIKLDEVFKVPAKRHPENGKNKISKKSYSKNQKQE